MHSNPENCGLGAAMFGLGLPGLQGPVQFQIHEFDSEAVMFAVAAAVEAVRSGVTIVR